MASGRLQVRSGHTVRLAYVRLVGHLDAASVGAVVEAVDAEVVDAPDHVVLDLTDLTGLDDAGAEAIVRIVAGCEAMAAHVVVLGGPRQANATLEALPVDQIRSLRTTGD